MKTTIHSLVLAAFLVSAAVFSQNLTLVKDINPGSANAFPNGLTELNGKMYFFALTGTSYKLFISDGTAAGTKSIGPIANGNIYYLTKFNGKLFFTFDDGVNGLELWTSDGTASGTVIFKDIWPGNLGSLPRYFTECNGLLYFQASTAARGQGLWVTDGTLAGTRQLGNQYSNPFSETERFLVFNNEIYFQGNPGNGYGMWKSNGTEAGTQLVKSGIIGTAGTSYAVLNNTFYFTNGDNIIGNELWTSDGTATGTVLIKDIQAGIQSSTPLQFLAFNGKVYFTADNGVNGREIWVSDGTDAGTQLLMDVNPGNAGSDPEQLRVFNGKVYFFAYNGTSGNLYQTNGTVAGTALVQTLPMTRSVSYSYEFRNKIYFVSEASIGAGGGFIGRTDGSVAGTFLIEPFVSTLSYTDMKFLNFENELYLPANFDGSGLELCKLDATLALRNAASEKFSIYPNPSENGLFSVHGGNTISEIKVYDLLGKSILLETIGINQFRIVAATGVYQLQISTKESERQFIKLVIK